MSAAPHIFSGLKVLDLASFVAAPAAATILGDYGADVIKVEPKTGDPHRTIYRIPPNPVSDFNYPWQLTNRNKRSIALDLKAPGARDVIERLVREADVVVVNFPPSVKKRLGITYEDLSALNPRLIYADVTGYGPLGPEADKPGFDLTAYWARSGLMQVTHDAGSAPTIPISAFGDQGTAMGLFAAIVTALYARERTGTGDHVTTSLIAEGAWAAGTWIEAGLHGATFFPQHDRKAPPNALWNPYRTSDDRWFLIMAPQEKDWPGFVAAIDRPELLVDPRFADGHARAANAAILVEILDALFLTAPLARWKALLDAGRVIFGVVQNAAEILSDPQMLANDVFVPLKEPLGNAKYTVNSPLTIAGQPKVAPGRAPEIGEHGDEILSELGFETAEIEALHASDVVGRFAK